MRDLGELAEGFFRVWCSSVGLIANGSKIDKTGWDFFVEFPWKEDESIAKDMLPSPIECKVQIKGTDHKNRTVAIYLSNLNRLIKVQLPAFYCLIEFDGKNEPQSAFLAHVDKSMIEKTLKRIRELEFEKGDRRLNKHTMNINFEEHQKLEAPFEESLKKAIEDYIPDGMEKYIENKNQLIKTLGFEDGSYMLKFTMSGEDSIKHIIDASLGLREKVDIDSVESHHVRFGILSDKPAFHFKNGQLSFGDVKPVSKATVRFREYDFSPSLSFESRMYFSPLTHLAPEKFMKVRLEGEFFQMILEPFNRSIKYSFSLRNEGKSSLRELRNILKVLMLFKKSADGLLLEIEPESKSVPPISLRTLVNDDVGDWSGIYQIAEMAAMICQRFNVSDNDVILDIDGLERSSESIVNFYQAINTDARNAVLTFEAGGEIVQETAKIACILPFIATNIGSHTFGCLLGLVGLPVHSEEQYKLIPERLIIESPVVKKDGDFTDQDFIDGKISEFARKVSEDGIVPIVMARKPINQADGH